MSGLAEKRKELVDAITREAIFEGAVAVLTKYGLDGATMDRVAEAAGIAKGSLYKYFRTKKELLQFVHNRVVEPVQEALRHLVEEEQCPAPEKLTRITRRWREHLMDNRPLFEFLINDRTAKATLLDSEMTARALAVQQVAAIIEQGIKEGTFRPVDPLLVGDMFVAAAIGMVEHEFRSGQVRAVDEAVESLIDVFINGLAVRKS